MGGTVNYRRKPVDVDAVLWDGSEGAQEGLERILGGPVKRLEQGAVAVAGVIIPHGIWVVRLPHTVRYYKPKDFEAKYEVVPAETEA